MKTPEYYLCGCADAPVSLLVVTNKDAQRNALRAITAGTQWTFHEACTIRDAMDIMGTQDIGAIITDRELPDGTWMELLESLRTRRNPPRVIVFSAVADDRFWADVLNVGGYDVLATPFESNEVIRATHVAWLSWRRSARVTTPTKGAVSAPAPRWKSLFSAGAGR